MDVATTPHESALIAKQARTNWESAADTIQHQDTRRRPGYSDKVSSNQGNQKSVAVRTYGLKHVARDRSRNGCR